MVKPMSCGSLGRGPQPRGRGGERASLTSQKGVTGSAWGSTGDVPAPGGAASTFPTTHLPQARLAGASFSARVRGVL